MLIVDNTDKLNSIMEFKEGTFYKFVCLIRTKDYKDSDEKPILTCMEKQEILVKDWLIGSQEMLDKTLPDMLTFTNMFKCRLYMCTDRKSIVKTLKTMRDTVQKYLDPFIGNSNADCSVRAVKKICSSATNKDESSDSGGRKWLFDVDYDQIEVLIHPESILHSAVEYEDTSVIGQMGTPDMRLAIQYALTYPKREVLVNGESLDLTKIGSLTFIKPDFNRFHALELAYKAGKIGGSLPCVLNGANEMANLLFREGKIEFLQIEELVEKAMNAHQVIQDPNVSQLLEIDCWARDFVLKEINK